jgi:hypothetical protein
VTAAHREIVMLELHGWVLPFFVLSPTCLSCWQLLYQLLSQSLSSRDIPVFSRGIIVLQLLYDNDSALNRSNYLRYLQVQEEILKNLGNSILPFASLYDLTSFYFSVRIRLLS